MLSFVATLVLDGLSFGMVLFIISVGLTVTMGLMRVVNLAHGSFAMIGGYIAGYLTQRGTDFYLAVLAATIVTGILGGLAEVTVFRPLYRKGEMAQVLFTVGLVFVVTAAVSYLFGAFPYPVKFPAYLNHAVDIGFRTYPGYRLLLIVVGALIAGVLWFVIENSIYGARLRAAVDDATMARAVGMNVGVLFTATFIVGCALAGLGGAVGAGLLTPEPSYALKYVVLFLIVVTVGGEGSFKGSFVAAIALGLIETIAKYFFPDEATYMLYAAVFVLLLLRPNGLLQPRSAA